MPFEKGKSKTGGRKKGTPNRKKVVKLETYLAEADINIAKKLFETIDSIQDPTAKSKMLLELYKFVDSQKKDSELQDSSEEDEKQSEPEAIDVLQVIK
jgi:hypothetical protein